MTIVYHWNDIKERLRFHQDRLGLSRKDIIEYLEEKYNSTFYNLSDNEIIELGINMGKSADKADFFATNPVTIIGRDNENQK